MSTLNIIGEFFYNWESHMNFVAARDLTVALADGAPRGHASTLLIASDTIAPEVTHVKSSVAKIPLRSSVLPIMWHSSQSARPLDGEYLHSFTPLAPLRTRDEYDGSQSSVMIPHTLAWDAPETLPKGQARQIRSFTRRALKHADVIVTPNHTVADRLQEIYGDAINPQVLPLAAPSELIAEETSSARRKELELPDKYVLTVTSTCDNGRLDWVLNTYRKNPDLPPLVIVVHGSKEFEGPDTSEFGERVTVFDPQNLNDLGVLIKEAELLLLPQQHIDTGFIAHSAIAQGVPIVHGGNKSLVELTIEGSVGGDSEESFETAILELCKDEKERERLSVLNQDRARSFSWAQTAWQLWEIHANI